MVILFEIGDYSLDGHEKIVPLHVETGYNPDQIAEAYALGTKVLGFDLKGEVCNEYEDYHMSEDHYNKLVAAGWNPTGHPDYFELADNGLGYYMSPRLLLSAFMFVVRLGNPDITWELVVPSHEAFFQCGHPNEIRRGGLGYGLFS